MGAEGHPTYSGDRSRNLHVIPKPKDALPKPHLTNACLVCSLYVRMSTPPNPAPPDDQTLLNALRHTGLRLIQSINSGLDAQPTPADISRLSAAFDRTGRGVRRTIAFCRHLEQPAPDLSARNPAKRAADRRQIIRTVEDAIERSRAPTDAAALRAELYERIETTELDEDLDNLPTEIIAANILRDFGLANIPYELPYPRRTPSHIAAIAARAAGRPVPPITEPPIADPPEPKALDLAGTTVESFLAWDKARRRPSALGP